MLLTKPELNLKELYEIDDHHLEDNFTKIYKLSLKRVQNKTNYSLNLPQECPYTLEQLLEEDWFPNN